MNKNVDKNVLLGLWRYLLPVPPSIWKKQAGGRFNLDFLSTVEQRLRNYVVLELPRYGRPLPPERIAGQLDLPLQQVTHILEKLERHKTFLYRNPAGEVTWAYPVTVDETPHQVAFSTGEQTNAA